MALYEKISKLIMTDRSNVRILIECQMHIYILIYTFLHMFIQYTGRHTQVAQHILQHLAQTY